MNYVNSAVRKKDAISLVSGKPVYTRDMIPQNTLVVKILRSPHAHAMIEDIDVSPCSAGSWRCLCADL